MISPSRIFFDEHISNILLTMVISITHIHSFSPNTFQFGKRLVWLPFVNDVVCRKWLFRPLRKSRKKEKDLFHLSLLWMWALYFCENCSKCARQVWCSCFLVYKYCHLKSVLTFLLRFGVRPVSCSIMKTFANLDKHWAKWWTNHYTAVLLNVKCAFLEYKYNNSHISILVMSVTIYFLSLILLNSVLIVSFKGTSVKSEIIVPNTFPDHSLKS